MTKLNWMLSAATIAFATVSAAAQTSSTGNAFGAVTSTPLQPSTVPAAAVLAANVPSSMLRISPTVAPPQDIPAFTSPTPASAFVPMATAPLNSSRTPATAALYRSVFAAIRDARWSEATALLAAMRDGPVHAVARAEIYLASGSPRVEADALLALLRAAPDLPQGAALASLAGARGAEYLPSLPIPQQLIGLSASPRRTRARSVEGDAASNALRIAAEPLIKNDQPAALEAMLIANELGLSVNAATEWEQKTAWAYYVVGNYDGARRLAMRAASGIGDWAVQGDWVLGLTAWRQADCATAADAFGRVAARATDVELTASGYYWAARADLVCKRPDRVQARMRSAARLSETFYGLLAAQALGIPAKPHQTAENTTALDARPNVRAAIMLAEIGEARLADTLIRYQARIGQRADHDGLIHLSARLNLPSTQYWLAHNGPAGASIHMEDRYPAPRYSPQRGWRVDRALVFAHTLQESSFRAGVVSPAGATGLMQVRPGTAGDIARSRGEYFSASQLSDPSYNIEYGQTYLEQLRDGGATGGLLPKVIAAYNAGPLPVSRWNASIRDGGDPLLYLESIPYWETRGYVPTILRNYWIYQAQAGEPSPSLVALVQGKWPLFPTVNRRTASTDEGQVAASN